MRILIVEDDPILGELVAAVLADHATAVESDGLGGLQRLAREPFDLAILDVDLPTLRGIGIAKAVRDFSSIPLIVYSAGLDWEAEALHAGANACLRKPFAPHDLERLVAAHGGVRARPAGASSDVRALSEEELAAIARMPRDQVDALPFGAIQLDGAGRIVAFNAYESAASGRTTGAVLGKRFADVAPCTTVKQFVAAHESSRAGPAAIRYVFPRHGASAVVTVRFFRDRGTTWLFVSQVPDARPLADA